MIHSNETTRKKLTRYNKQPYAVFLILNLLANYESQN